MLFTAPLALQNALRVQLPHAYIDHALENILGTKPAI